MGICTFFHMWFLFYNVAGWLEDAAYFAAIDSSLDAFSWYEWPEPLKDRHLAALQDIYHSKEHFVRSGWLAITYEFIVSYGIYT